MAASTIHSSAPAADGSARAVASAAECPGWRKRFPKPPPGPGHCAPSPVPRTALCRAVVTQAALGGFRVLRHPPISETPPKSTSKIGPKAAVVGRPNRLVKAREDDE